MALADTIQEAERLMVICNACRYCEGHCAVFPAMERRLAFPEADLRYLANLCHGCGSCFHHCQYAPPHEFDVNVPRVFTELRRQTYARYAWPRAAGAAFARNGLVAAVVMALSCLGFVLAGLALAGPDALRPRPGPGSFYRVVPHDLMVGLFGVAFGYGLLALALATRRFWREAGDPGAVPASALRRASADALKLRYLGGGGDGCTYPDERPSTRRRLYHHLTYYGFLLCFAATCAAAFREYVEGVVAPYGWLSAPVLLGTLGGVGLVVGPVGLLALKVRSDREPYPRTALDVAFLLSLLLTSVTGFLVLLLRETSAMGVLLLLHLGAVLAFFLTMPYGKFIHAFLRYAALVRYAMERARPPASPES